MVFADILPRLSKKDALLEMTAYDFLLFHGHRHPDANLLFNHDTLAEMDDILDLSIHVFQVENGSINLTSNIVRGVLGANRVLKLAVNDQALIENSKAKFYLIANDKVFITIYRCENCHFTTNDKRDLAVHNNKKYSCGKLETIVKSKQRSYGDPDTLLQKTIQRGYLPKSFLNFRQQFLICFDIECLEEPDEDPDYVANTTTEARHRLVSIAFSTNIPDQRDVYIVRRSSDPQCEQEVINTFVDKLSALHDVYTEKYLPSEVFTAYENITNDLKSKFNSKNAELQSIKRFLDGYLKLPFFGFNACKFVFPGFLIFFLI